ncbi:MAG TPA: voltage-gated potassium channel protein [Rhodanobacteraceae bacterium]|jgi:voltage-gated potassium channel|nr:voltage-gated potassium channel protein [Rhodanobacteraceae bacterium]
MQPSPTQLLRNRLQELHKRIGGEHWFPHVPLAILLGLGGLWLLQADLGRHWQDIVARLLGGGQGLHPALLPPLLIGVGMLVMALGLLLRSRLAWAMALLLAAAAAASMFFGHHPHAHLLLGYFVLMLALLGFAWRQFDRSSVAASTLFALTSVVMLLIYATFGTFYLGSDFKPPITDLVTALYYAMVTMSTVGYGDIIPQTAEAKLFAVSIIVLGVAVFATSLTAVIAPLVTRSFQRIVDRKGSRMLRENHFVVIGDSSLALNTWRELASRGQPVTRLLRREPETGLPGDVDVVIGESSDADVLRKAGADKAQAVLAMLDDDSENAFVVLAVRELRGSARTVAAVNDAHHLARVKLVQPDVVIAPQILGGELAAMLLSGEPVTADFIMQRVFQTRAGADAQTHSPG